MKQKNSEIKIEKKKTRLEFYRSNFFKTKNEKQVCHLKIRKGKREI